MKKALKEKCSLEEEYAFEHKQRIKAEAYIEEVWQFNQELTKEVLRLQKLVNEGKYAEKQNEPSEAKYDLNLRIRKIFEDREKAIKKMENKWQKPNELKKSIDESLKNIEVNLSNVYMETHKLNTFMIGLENLVMYLAEHLDKKESFEEFIKEKMEEHKKELDKVDLPEEK